MNYASVHHAELQEKVSGFAAQIVALVGSRLCHDLISPLGAIGNGVELLRMTGGWPGLETSPEMGLIEDALQSAQARISCFRIAFGTAGETQRISRTELTALISDMERAGRLNVTLLAEGDQARGIVKLLLLSLMCLETAMPWGAQVTIGQQDREWRLAARADRVRTDSALWSWLDDGVVDASGVDGQVPIASEVHFPLLGMAAADMGRRIRWSLSETGGEIVF
ncbi:MAG: histidine phosphotransferase family protein [Paracoccus sp. (in: a-proteobacteria)]